MQWKYIFFDFPPNTLDSNLLGDPMALPAPVTNTVSVLYLYLIIDWEGRESRTGPLRAGLRVGTDGLGQYKTPGMPGFLRAQRGRARSALLWRVKIIVMFIGHFPLNYLG